MNTLKPKNKEEYRAFVMGRKDIPIFFQPWWMDTLCGEDNWDVLLAKDNQDQIRGIWPLPKQKLFGIPVSRHIPLTPFLGIITFFPDTLENLVKRKRYHKKILVQLIKQHQKLPYFYFNQFFPNDFSNWLPFYWNGYRQETYYRYIINLRKKTSLTFSNFSRTTRKSIRKFERNGYVSMADDIEELFVVLMKSYKYSKQKLPFSIKTLQQLYSNISKKNRCLILIAKNNDKNKTVGGSIMVIDNNIAYLLAQGLVTEYRNSEAASALVWHNIQFASRHAHYFDFCGSMIKRISDFIQGFGGELKPYHKIYQSSNRWMDLLLKMK